MPLDGSEIAERALPVAGARSTMMDAPIALVTVAVHDDHVATAERVLRRASVQLDPPVDGEVLVGLPASRMLLGYLRPDRGAGKETTVSDRPELLGLHHVRLPVTDVMASRDWYTEILGFSPLMVTEEEASVIGEALVHESGLVVGLHADRDRARSLEGFCVLALSVEDVRAWKDYFDRMDVQHTLLEQGPRGDHLCVSDPDGLVVELHTLAQPSPEDT